MPAEHPGVTFGPFTAETRFDPRWARQLNQIVIRISCSKYFSVRKLYGKAGFEQSWMPANKIAEFGLRFSKRSALAARRRS